MTRIFIINPVFCNNFKQFHYVMYRKFMAGKNSNSHRKHNGITCGRLYYKATSDVETYCRINNVKRWANCVGSVGGFVTEQVPWYFNTYILKYIFKCEMSTNWCVIWCKSGFSNGLNLLKSSKRFIFTAVSAKN
jgi:hypothetical protein